MSMSFKASPDGTYGEVLVNGAVVAKLPVTGNAVIPNLVGTVSQSGGIPTGAVVERGSNANGEYVRFADGTQICTNLAAVIQSSAAGPITWIYPAAFVGSTPAVPAQTSSATAARIFYLGNTQLTSVEFSGYDLSFNRAAGAFIKPVAIGRWF